jgi:uncharacterized protein
LSDLATGLALVLVVEGTLYALFPLGMQRMAVQMAAVPSAVLRATGLFAAAIGVAAVWLIRR